MTLTSTPPGLGNENVISYLLPSRGGYAKLNTHARGETYNPYTKFRSRGAPSLEDSDFGRLRTFDAVLVTVRHGQSRYSTLDRALAAIGPRPFVGLVLTGAEALD